jgi:hypothetical protein
VRVNRALRRHFSQAANESSYPFERKWVASQILFALLLSTGENGLVAPSVRLARRPPSQLDAAPDRPLAAAKDCPVVPMRALPTASTHQLQEVASSSKSIAANAHECFGVPDSRIHLPISPKLPGPVAIRGDTSRAPQTRLRRAQRDQVDFSPSSKTTESSPALNWRRGIGVEVFTALWQQPNACI